MINFDQIREKHSHHEKLWDILEYLLYPSTDRFDIFTMDQLGAACDLNDKNIPEIVTGLNILLDEKLIKESYVVKDWNNELLIGEYSTLEKIPQIVTRLNGEKINLNLCDVVPIFRVIE